MTDQISVIDIPIDNICVVLEHSPIGVVRLFCANIYADNDAEKDKKTMIDVPPEFNVFSRRSGKVYTSYGNGKYFVLGYHDEYEVEYKGIKMRIGSKTIMNVNVEDAGSESKDQTRYSDWCHIRS